MYTAFPSHCEKAVSQLEPARSDHYAGELSLVLRLHLNKKVFLHVKEKNCMKTIPTNLECIKIHEQNQLFNINLSESYERK